MPINQATLARRLKEAREAARITQEAAAEALGLARTALAHIEAGNCSVSTIELVELAKLYGRDIASFITEDQAKTEDDALLTLYRMDEHFADTPKVQRSVSKCLDICREGTRFEEMLDYSRRSGPPAYQLEAPRNPAEAVQHGERIAGEERKRIGIGDAPIGDVPELINTQGVWATGAELPQAMSGLFLRHPSIGMVILVNHRHAPHRKRFSYAHEYGHCLLDRDQPVTITTAQNQNNLPEVRANAFAAAFLMPAAGVHAFLDSRDKGAPTRQTLHLYTAADTDTENPVEAQRRPAPGSQTIVYQDVAQLVYHFGASYSAAVYRLRNLGRISQAECTSLLAHERHALDYLKLLRDLDETEETGEAKPEPNLVNQVADLAVEAFRRDEISRGKVLEIAKTLGIEKGAQLVSLAKASLVG